MDFETLASRVAEVAQLSGEFRLRSGLIADTYFDKYQFESDPAILQAVAALCVIDREQGGSDALAAAQLSFSSVFKRSDIER